MLQGNVTFVNKTKTTEHVELFCPCIQLREVNLYRVFVYSLVLLVVFV